jgi:amino acid adenylation domain-containing protein
MYGQTGQSPLDNFTAVHAARLRSARPPLSFAQQRLWFLDQLVPGSFVYNVPLSYRLRGELHAGVLQEALIRVVAHHETLRTRYAVADGEPYQVIEDPERFVLERIDLSGIPIPVNEAHRLAQQEAETPFDLATGPLFRSRLVRLGHDDHVLMVTVHHSVFDGWSIDVFQRDLSQAYDALLGGREPDWDPLLVQYADFAAWQRKSLSAEMLQEQLVYWRDQLRDMPPTLDLPTDRPRPPVPSYRGSRVEFVVGAQVVDRLREIARECRATLFAVTLAAYQALLATYANGRDIVVGVPTSERNISELEPLIGFFVNSLPVRVDLSDDPPFSRLVKQVREVLFDALANSDVPFERLVEELEVPRDLSRNPVFQVWHELADQRTDLSLGPIRVERFRRQGDSTPFDMELHLSGSGTGSLTGQLVYARDLFDEATMQRFAEHYVNLVTAVADDAEAQVSRIDVLSSAERHQLMDGWNHTKDWYTAHRTISEWFEAQAADTPQATAIVFGSVSLSYEQLNRRANQLAAFLQDSGVGPERVVGLCVHRGIDMVVGLLGILKAGAAYLPVDPDYPRERIGYMLTNANASPVLTHSDLTERLPLQAWPVIRMDTEWERVARYPSYNLRQFALPENLLYVIYTSGSTGQPKGVAMAQRPLLNLLHWQLNRSETAGPTLQFGAISFDQSFQEIFSTLLAGGTLVLLGKDDRADPERLLQTMIETGVRRLFCLPLVLDQLARVAAGRTRLPRLREIIAAGEQLHFSNVIRELLERLGEVSIDNQYGPTETHAVTALRLVGDPADWPDSPSIGAPIANARIYVLSPELRLLPIGVVGEVCIGGGGLARGYIRRPGLTAERFIPDPFAAVPGQRLYRTGDLARWRANGTLEFLGRIDHQIKIRGFRVEPGEIEAVLLAYPRVGDAAVLPVETGPDRRLAAYFVPRAQPSPTAAELRAHLKTVLPDYMIPSHYVSVAELPLTKVGKLDRAALATALAEEVTDHGFVPARSQTEKTMAAIWCEALGRSEVGIDEDFFELGGHSLLATSITISIREVLGIHLPLRAIFDHPTIQDLASLVEGYQARQRQSCS